MLLFKTSAATIDNVIKHKKHALKHEPRAWEKGEVLLISKNKGDCIKNEKQIQYLMTLVSIKKATNSEIKKYWPKAKNNWSYLVICSKVIQLEKPFDLIDILGKTGSSKYGPSLKPKKISSHDENKILHHLNAPHINL